ncbi:MAG: translesion error-prone DNA polymerase V autoproteolytic subunit [Pseudomonadota bacterium]
MFQNVTGFPSAAEDFQAKGLNLNDYVVSKPAATVFARATGNAMIQVGIDDGDLLVIDRSLYPQQGNTVVVAIDGELVCRIYDKNKQQLVPGNPACAPTSFYESMEIEGVVTYVIKKL